MQKTLCQVCDKTMMTVIDKYTHLLTAILNDKYSTMHTINEYKLFSLYIIMQF